MRLGLVLVNIRAKVARMFTPEGELRSAVQERAEKAQAAESLGALGNSQEAPSESSNLAGGSQAEKTGWEQAGEKAAAKAQKEHQEAEQHQGQMAADDSKASKSQSAANQEAGANQKASASTARVAKAQRLSAALAESREKRLTKDNGYSKGH